MPTPPAAAVPTADRLACTIRRQRLALAGLTGAFVLAVGLGFGLVQPPHTPASSLKTSSKITHYAAGDNRLYRFWDNGDIDYLTIDFDHGSVEGIPSWTRLRIDNSLTRDRMGNVIRVPGR